MINAHMDAAEKCISKRKRVKKTSALGERTCQEEKERIKESLYETKRLPNSNNANHLKQAKEELQAACDNKQAEYLTQKCAEIKNAAVQHQAKIASGTMNEITRKTSSGTGRLKAKQMK